MCEPRTREAEQHSCLLAPRGEKLEKVTTARPRQSPVGMACKREQIQGQHKAWVVAESWSSWA